MTPAAVIINATFLFTTRLYLHRIVLYIAVYETTRTCCFINDIIIYFIVDVELDNTIILYYDRDHTIRVKGEGGKKIYSITLTASPGYIYIIQYSKIANPISHAIYSLATAMRQCEILYTIIIIFYSRFSF